jgi:hypothetical protein
MEAPPKSHVFFSPKVHNTPEAELDDEVWPPLRAHRRLTLRELQLQIRSVLEWSGRSYVVNVRRLPLSVDNTGN